MSVFLQPLVKSEPYNITLRLALADTYQTLRYPDLAAGEAYKALLLVDEVCDESGEYHELAFEAARQAIATQIESTGEELKRDGVTSETTDEEVSLWAEGPFSEASYTALIANLAACGCLRSASELYAQMMKKHPHLSRDDLRRALVDIGVQALPESGLVRRELYPWNDHEPDRFAEETLNFLNEWMQDAGPKLEVRATALPVLSPNASGSSESSVTRQFGVFAKDELKPGETVLLETSLLTANSRLHGDFCDACSATLPSIANAPTSSIDSRTNTVCCDECDDAVFCSQSCLEMAQETYHPAVCGRDISAIARDVPPVEVADALYSLLLLRAMAMSETQDIHPLDVKEVKYLWGDFCSRSPWDIFNQDSTNAHGSLPRALPFSFKYQILMPLNMLEKMDVNIFDNGGRFDTWVLNTLYSKFRGTASARQGHDGRPDVSAVHPLWSLANHSCDPHGTWEWEGKMKFWVKPERAQWLGKPVGDKRQAGVQKGKEVMNHYCDVDLDVRERREWAAGALGGVCKCERCLWEEQHYTLEGST
ncbi:hypothetical protein NA57DRAFT_67915 [Rhizodiscina lignyota]|uniref:SET domain-containing protein n=1 Tax=Rhizodiscina lignyota TaxID=1504668 RepID=A0A9P4IC42_9PEZI|nr:hypothetical protein NA57DRAFT_67915 [Rhizodiscina lignyota]